MPRAGVVEWQTRRTQNPVGETLCGFKSRLRHQDFPPNLLDLIALASVGRVRAPISLSSAIEALLENLCGVLCVVVEIGVMGTGSFFYLDYFRNEIRPLPAGTSVI